jgi:purine-binding chemotaxis protein CheW
MEYMTEPDEKTSEDTRLVATFLLAGGLFGIDTALIQEVSKVGAITPVRHAPAYVMGIRNLRGKIVTVIDLQARLELGTGDLTHESRILIVENAGEPVGLVVDGVSDTISINQADIKPPPPGLHSIQAKNLLGVHRTGERIVSLLDPAVILQAEEERAREIAVKEPVAS